MRPGWAAGHLKLVAFVQERDSRRILAAAGDLVSASTGTDAESGHL